MCIDKLLEKKEKSERKYIIDIKSELRKKIEKKKRKNRTIRTVSLFDFGFFNLLWTVQMISNVLVLCSLELFLLNIFTHRSTKERERDYRFITNWEEEKLKKRKEK